MTVSTCSSIVQNVFRRTGSLKRLRAELSVYYWPRVAGGEIAKNVIAVRYFNGYLYLKTESPTLAHQLMMMNPDIVKRYRLLLGPEVIKGIKVKIGSIERPPKINQVEPNPELNEQEKEFIADNCQVIKDPELAQLFQRVMQKSFEAQNRLKARGAACCLSCNVIIDQEHSYCPVCETKLQDEMVSYIKYLKKHRQEVNLSDLPLPLTEANEELIRKMLNY